MQGKCKSSGIPWIGDIPENWEISKIKYSSYVKGRVGWHGLRADEFTNEGPYLITGTDFENGKVDWDKCYHVSEQRYDQDPYIQVRDEDVLITKDGTIGKLAFVDKLPGPATLNSHLLIIRPLDGKYKPRFLYWVLSGSYFEVYVKLTQTGTTFFGITQEKIRNFAFAMPSISEQENIVKFLDRRVALVDSLISKHNQLADLLEEKRQAVIKEVVTKGLNPNVSMKKTETKWIENIPKHWNMAAIGQVYDIQLGKMLKGKKSAENEILVPYLNADSMQDGNIRIDDMQKMWASEEEIDKYLVRPGDLLVCEGGALAGKSAMMEKEVKNCIIQNAVHRVRSEPRSNLKYLLYVLNYYYHSGLLAAIAASATIPHFTRVKFAKLKMPYPPPEEQSDIANFLEKQMITYAGLIREIGEQTGKFIEYRQSLISAAVTGRVGLKEIATQYGSR